MNSTSISLDPLASKADTVSVDLPADVVSMLKAEARARRKPVSAYLREWLEDQADGREAAKRWKDLQSGKVKASPADDVYKRLGI